MAQRMRDGESARRPGRFQLREGATCRESRRPLRSACWSAPSPCHERECGPQHADSVAIATSANPSSFHFDSPDHLSADHSKPHSLDLTTTHHGNHAPSISTILLAQKSPPCSLRLGQGHFMGRL